MNIVQSWKKNSGFRSYTFQMYPCFRVSPEYLNLKFFLNCIQNRFRTLAYSELKKY